MRARAAARQAGAPRRAQLRQPVHQRALVQPRGGGPQEVQQRNSSED